MTRNLRAIEGNADLSRVEVVGVELEASIEGGALGKLLGIADVEDAVGVHLAPDRLVGVELRISKCGNTSGCRGSTNQTDVHARHKDNPGKSRVRGLL